MHKLKNQQGATLMMALLLLLAASMVSAVILTAATSSARRLENDRAARQAYLTVSSAARLLRDDILNASFVQETVKTTYTNDTSTETSRETTSPTGFTAAWLKAGKAAVDRELYRHHHPIRGRAGRCLRRLYHGAQLRHHHRPAPGRRRRQ